MHAVQDHYADPIFDDMLSREVIVDNRNNSNRLGNYQVSLDFKDDLFFANQDDLLFVDSDLRLLSHWNESFPNREWIEVLKIPSAALCSVKMLSGCPSSGGSKSDGDSTFNFFDDFDNLIGFDRISYATLWSGAGSTDWLGRPHLLDNSGTLIAIYRQASVHTYDAAAVFHIRFSTDDGTNWTAVDTYTDSNPVTGFPLDGHPNCASDGIIMKAPNGDLLIHVYEWGSATTRNGTYQYRSTDNGASWSDEGKINSDSDLVGGQDFVVVDSTLYLVVWVDPGANFVRPYYSALYKSINNGTSWTHVSDITTTTDNKTNEAGIEYCGGNTLLCVLRDLDDAKTYQCKSTDLGATWGSLIDKTSHLSVLQRPRMRIFSGDVDRIYLFGRQAFAGTDYTAIYYSEDDGDTWVQKFYPDPSSYTDCGYCDVHKKLNGDFYMLSYAGPSALVASIKKYIFEKGGGMDNAKWESSGTPSVSGTVMHLNNNDKLLGKTSYGFEYAIEARVKCDEQDVDFISLGDALVDLNRIMITNSDHVSACDADNFDCFQCTTKKDTEFDTEYIDGVWHDFRNIYYVYRLKRYSATHTIFEQSENSYTDPDNVHVPTVDLKPYFRVWDSSQVSTLDIDWVFVRKYASPDPTAEIGAMI